MAASTRIKGAALQLTIASTDYYADITACTITNEEADGDVTTFADAAAGGTRKYLMNITGIQSTDTASLWSYIWDNAGTTATYVYAPHGNAVASATKPHFTGSVVIGPPPVIGGEAGASNTYIFESVWECTAKPTKKTSNT